jgi:hypothetical protein
MMDVVNGGLLLRKETCSQVEDELRPIAVLRFALKPITVAGHGFDLTLGVVSLGIEPLAPDPDRVPQLHASRQEPLGIVEVEELADEAEVGLLGVATLRGHVS